jgi:hypothetical protein
VSLHERFVAGLRVVVRTSHDRPPVATRRFDWSAVDDGAYQPGEPVGQGETEDAAIADLITKLEERI